MALDPFLVGIFEKQRAAGMPSLSAGTPAEGRALVAQSRAALGTGPDMTVNDLSIPGPAGAIPARLYLPEGPQALIVYYHGGGFVLGSLDDFDTLVRTLAARAGAAVLSVDYRLAPEHRFPAAVEDAEAAVRWAAREAPAGAGLPLVLAGDSAGGNLATVTARRLRGQVPVALQILAYPVTDSDTDTRSYREESDGLPLTRDDMIWFMDHYAPDPATRTHPDLAPLRAPDISGLPPALVMTAEHDVLRDEGEAYARHLEANGVPVELRRYDGASHGFLRMHNIFPLADRALEDAAAAVRRVVQGAWQPGLPAGQRDAG